MLLLPFANGDLWKRTIALLQQITLERRSDEVIPQTAQRAFFFGRQGVSSVLEQSAQDELTE